jgi:hypothetical protein
MQPKAIHISFKANIDKAKKCAAKRKRLMDVGMLKPS